MYSQLIYAGVAGLSYLIKIPLLVITRMSNVEECCEISQHCECLGEENNDVY